MGKFFLFIFMYCHVAFSDNCKGNKVPLPNVDMDNNTDIVHKINNCYQPEKIKAFDRSKDRFPSSNNAEKATFLNRHFGNLVSNMDNLAKDLISKAFSTANDKVNDFGFNLLDEKTFARSLDTAIEKAEIDFDNNKGLRVQELKEAKKAEKERINKVVQDFRKSGESKGIFSLFKEIKIRAQENKTKKENLQEDKIEKKNRKSIATYVGYVHKHLRDQLVSPIMGNIIDQSFKKLAPQVDFKKFGIYPHQMASTMLSDYKICLKNAAGENNKDTENEFKKLATLNAFDDCDRFLLQSLPIRLFDQLQEKLIGDSINKLLDKKNSNTNKSFNDKFKEYGITPPNISELGNHLSESFDQCVQDKYMPGIRGKSLGDVNYGHLSKQLQGCAAFGAINAGDDYLKGVVSPLVNVMLQDFNGGQKVDSKTLEAMRSDLLPKLKNKLDLCLKNDPNNALLCSVEEKIANVHFHNLTNLGPEKIQEKIMSCLEKVLFKDALKDLSDLAMPLLPAIKNIYKGDAAKELIRLGATNKIKESVNNCTNSLEIAYVDLFNQKNREKCIQYTIMDVKPVFIADQLNITKEKFSKAIPTLKDRAEFQNITSDYKVCEEDNVSSFLPEIIQKEDYFQNEAETFVFLNQMRKERHPLTLIEGNDIFSTRDEEELQALIKNFHTKNKSVSPYMILLELRRNHCAKDAIIKLSDVTLENIIPQKLSKTFGMENSSSVDISFIRNEVRQCIHEKFEIIDRVEDLAKNKTQLVQNCTNQFTENFINDHSNEFFDELAQSAVDNISKSNVKSDALNLLKEKYFSSKHGVNAKCIEKIDQQSIDSKLQGISNCAFTSFDKFFNEASDQNVFNMSSEMAQSLKEDWNLNKNTFKVCVNEKFNRASNLMKEEFNDKYFRSIFDSIKEINSICLENILKEITLSQTESSVESALDKLHESFSDNDETSKVVTIANELGIDFSSEEIAEFKKELIGSKTSPGKLKLCLSKIDKDNNFIDEYKDCIYRSVDNTVKFVSDKLDIEPSHFNILQDNLKKCIDGKTSEDKYLTTLLLKTPNIYTTCKEVTLKSIPLLIKDVAPKVVTKTIDREVLQISKTGWSNYDRELENLNQLIFPNLDYEEVIKSLPKNDKMKDLNAKELSARVNQTKEILSEGLTFGLKNNHDQKRLQNLKNLNKEITELVQSKNQSKIGLKDLENLFVKPSKDKKLTPIDYVLMSFISKKVHDKLINFEYKGEKVFSSDSIIKATSPEIISKIFEKSENYPLLVDLKKEMTQVLAGQKSSSDVPSIDLRNRLIDAFFENRGSEGFIETVIEGSRVKGLVNNTAAGITATATILFPPLIFKRDLSQKVKNKEIDEIRDYIKSK